MGCEEDVVVSLWQTELLEHMCRTAEDKAGRLSTCGNSRSAVRREIGRPITFIAVFVAATRLRITRKRKESAYIAKGEVTSRTLPTTLKSHHISSLAGIPIKPVIGLVKQRAKSYV